MKKISWWDVYEASLSEMYIRKILWWDIYKQDLVYFIKYISWCFIYENISWWIIYEKDYTNLEFYHSGWMYVYNLTFWWHVDICRIPPLVYTVYHWLFKFCVDCVSKSPASWPRWGFLRGIILLRSDVGHLYAKLCIYHNHYWFIIDNLPKKIHLFWELCSLFSLSFLWLL